MTTTAVPSARQLYDTTAGGWVRKEPITLSDFTGRIPLLKMAEPVAGKRVLDLGCGEGYFARHLKSRGASKVIGVDQSAGMIELAERQERDQPLGIDYLQRCATDLAIFADQQFDMTIAVFLFNYLTVAQTQRCMAEVARVLKPGGRFLFAVPHPGFAFMRDPAPPFYFTVEGAGYFTGRDRQCAGRIWKRDGTFLEVQLVHKTLQDYFEALAKAGFTTLPRLVELRVTPELEALDPAFFGPAADTPLHMAIEVTR
jgi:SAM-dependent methyltransferase